MLDYKNTPTPENNQPQLLLETNQPQRAIALLHCIDLIDDFFQSSLSHLLLKRQHVPPQLNTLHCLLVYQLFSMTFVMKSIDDHAFASFENQMDHSMHRYKGVLVTELFTDLEFQSGKGLALEKLFGGTLNRPRPSPLRDIADRTVYRSRQ